MLKLSTGKTAPFVAAPILWALHTGAANPIFTGGQPQSGNGLEQLAETGNPEGLVKHLSGASGVTAVGANALPVGDTAEGPLTPGKAYEFEVSASPGQTLSLGVDVRPVERSVLLQRSSDRALRRAGSR